MTFRHPTHPRIGIIGIGLVVTFLRKSRLCLFQNLYLQISMVINRFVVAMHGNNVAMIIIRLWQNAIFIVGRCQVSSWNHIHCNGLTIVRAIAFWSHPTTNKTNNDNQATKRRGKNNDQKWRCFNKRNRQRQGRKSSGCVGGYAVRNSGKNGSLSLHLLLWNNL